MIIADNTQLAIAVKMTIQLLKLSGDYSNSPPEVNASLFTDFLLFLSPTSSLVT